MKELTLLLCVSAILSNHSRVAGKGARPQTGKHLFLREERRVGRQAGAMLLFSRRQCFDMGREGDKLTFRDRRTIHPAQSPGYERLYYAPNGAEMARCFEPESKQELLKKTPDTLAQK